MNPQRLRQHAQDRFKPDEIIVLTTGNAHKIPFLPKKRLTPAGKGKKRRFLQWTVIRHVNHTLGGPTGNRLCVVCVCGMHACTFCLGVGFVIVFGLFV